MSGLMGITVIFLALFPTSAKLSLVSPEKNNPKLFDTSTSLQLRHRAGFEGMTSTETDRRWSDGVQWDRKVLAEQAGVRTWRPLRDQMSYPSSIKFLYNTWHERPRNKNSPVKYKEIGLKTMLRSLPAVLDYYIPRNSKTRTVVITALISEKSWVLPWMEHLYCGLWNLIWYQSGYWNIKI